MEPEEVGQCEYGMERLGEGKWSKGMKGGKGEGANLLIIKWTMECALKGTSKTALCILMECETVWMPLH